MPLRFRVLRPHAKGGLGEVFVARDEELHREVALKEIQGRHADDAHSRARFLVEAEITGGLEHPGIVPVYGLGHYPDGRPFYAMRFIRGDSLHEALDRFHQADGPGLDPHTDALARASPKDPKGFHLLLLAAGDVPAEKGTPLLQKQLAGVGKPPAFTWAGKLRGPEEVELSGELPPAYLERINSLMPQGLRPVYALFFQTVP
jgi:hypothetical protein